MMHGTKERFGIQWELDEDPGGKFLLGRVCFWAGGVMIGEYELGTSLCDVLVNLSYPAGDCGKRQSRRLCGMCGKDAFYLLHGGLFEDDPTVSRLVEDESWARFDVSLSVDVFDGWRLYLIDCPINSRLLVGRRAPDCARYEFAFEQQLAIGEFDAVIRAFRQELQASFKLFAGD